MHADALDSPWRALFAGFSVLSSKRLFNPDGPFALNPAFYTTIHRLINLPQYHKILSSLLLVITRFLPICQRTSFRHSLPWLKRPPLILCSSLRSFPVWSHSVLCHRKFIGCNSLKLFNSESSNEPGYIFIMTENNIDHDIQLGDREGLYFSSSQTPPSSSASSCYGGPIALSHKTPLSLNLQPSLNLDILSYQHNADQHSSSARTYGSNNAWTPEYFTPLDLCCDCCPSQKDNTGNKSDVELIRCVDSSALIHPTGTSSVDSSHASLREHDDLSQKVGQWVNRASEIRNG